MMPISSARFMRHAITIGIAALALPAAAATQVLYDPSVGSADPAAGGWLAGAFLFNTVSFSSAGALMLPASGNIGVGGYSNYKVNAAFPVLDSSTGYSLSFTMKVSDENHVGNSSRAGFSVSLIGNDLKGVEIGFQSDRIFAQNLVNNDFVAGENTTDASFVAAAMTSNRWSLAVSGSSYTLSEGGQTVLTGALHDYSSYTGDGQSAYTTPNFVFLGDDTKSAGARTLLSYAAITTVPEPASWALLMIGGLGLLGARRRFFIS